jgi:hypothetical protein
MHTSTLIIAYTLKVNAFGDFFSCGTTGNGTLCSMTGDDTITSVEYETSLELRKEFPCKIEHINNRK